MKIQFTMQTSLGGGVIASADEVLELGDAQARELVNSNKAEKYVDPPIAAVTASTPEQDAGGKPDDPPEEKKTKTKKEK